jgi:serine phosphatase RsbU (regulator of sigma subunit)
VRAGGFIFLLFVYAKGRTSMRQQTELSLAHGIQHTPVPTVRFQSAVCEIYGISLPSEKVGGGLVDLVREEDGSVRAYMADISGHGLQAGIMMGIFKTAARTATAVRPSLTSLMKRVNQVLPQVEEPEMYVTCAAVRITSGAANGGGCRFEAANAGHPAILYLSAQQKKVQ